MIILELFSGTKSIGNVFEKENHTVISVDIDNHFKPTHNESIHDFDYKQYKHFDYIHASPPCKWFSGLQMTWYNRMRKINGDLVYYDKYINEIMVENESDLFVKKALEIINYFNPTCWTMENPYSSNRYALHKRPYMTNYKYSIVDYCMYNYDIRKTTIIFNNFNLKLNRCNKTHIHKRLGSSYDKNKISKKTLYERYVIPNELCKEIYKQIINRIAF
tara:strand:- start:50 stop:703 length:654 start_codon:yes stop_codon:yes gene_type:complete